MTKYTMTQLVFPAKQGDYNPSYTPGKVVDAKQVGVNILVRFLSPEGTMQETCAISVRNWKPGGVIGGGGLLGAFGPLVVTGSCFT
jgi:hypothetical protein